MDERSRAHEPGLAINSDARSLVRLGPAAALAIFLGAALVTGCASSPKSQEEICEERVEAQLESCLEEAERQYDECEGEYGHNESDSGESPTDDEDLSILQQILVEAMGAVIKSSLDAGAEKAFGHVSCDRAQSRSEDECEAEKDHAMSQCGG